MSDYLYQFGFESPSQRLANDRHGWDDEDSYAFFVTAETAELALEWGREISEAFCRYLYRKSGWTEALPSWKADGYAHWIEEDLEAIAEARKSGVPRVGAGTMPEFAELPDVL